MFKSCSTCLSLEGRHSAVEKMLHKVGRIFKDKVVVYVAETQKESRSGQKRVTQGKHGGAEVRRSWLVQSK